MHGRPLPLIRRANRGFTLIELAIVLIIVALLSGGLMMTVSAQMERIATSDTQRRLDEARDALLGFAAANGRLPCPAVGGATGIEGPLGGGVCSNNWDGFLPAITLGIGPTNDNGYALDGWGNPIRYAITTYNNSAYCPGHVFATANCIKAVWNGGISLGNAPDLRICNTATGMTGTGATASCATGSELANNAVAVVFSRGRNGASPPASSDEIANGDADRAFVSHPPIPSGPNEFDDLVIWLSPNILYNRMIAAGRLP
ncbi:type II secretion system GspH family protein [Dechloromonas sp. XY25]|uniref:Type II secretion system GspH family protein n=1 Tax=Dechloromonas hankyongensis TaxID=2908002 RepID=A0ABS9K0C4_9RHOO|nr:type II secretion system protein [Dechloromonas hankyongensis]MCG2576593.1 type II secretion system GspH family protein [Dechloromonas hankyongensis]